VWSGTEFIANVSLDRQVRMQNVSGVGWEIGSLLFVCLSVREASPLKVLNEFS